MSEYTELKTEFISMEKMSETLLALNEVSKNESLNTEAIQLLVHKALVSVLNACINYYSTPDCAEQPLNNTAGSTNYNCAGNESA